MIVRPLTAVLLLLLFLTSACNQAVSTPPLPSVAPPSAGTSTFAGQVVSNTNKTPIKETIVQLAQVYRDANTQQAAFALDLARAPGTFTDQSGVFTITDVPPGEYVVVVGEFYGVNDIIKESNGDAKVYKAESGQVVNTGVLSVKPDVSPGR